MKQTNKRLGRKIPHHRHRGDKMCRPYVHGRQVLSSWRVLSSATKRTCGGRQYVPQMQAHFVAGDKTCQGDIMYIDRPVHYKWYTRYAVIDTQKHTYNILFAFHVTTDTFTDRSYLSSQVVLETILMSFICNVINLITNTSHKHQENKTKLLRSNHKIR